MRYFDRSLIEEEFRKRHARIVFQNSYHNRASRAGYFSSRSISNEAIVKLIHHKGNVVDLKRYVADKDKTDNQRYIFDSSGVTLSNAKLSEITGFWRKRDKEDRRENARHSTHVVMSTKETPTPGNIDKLRKVVSEVVLRQFTIDGFDSFFTIHTDKQHLHAHVVVHNKNLRTDKKIQFSKLEKIYLIKKDFAEALNRVAGWNYAVTSRKDFMSVRDGVDKRAKNQNYFLREVENQLGEEARDWAKKQLIVSLSKDKKKASVAKSNLARLRQVSSFGTEEREKLLNDIKVYSRQREKWEIKQNLGAALGQYPRDTINAFVDGVYTLHQSRERRFNTRRPSSARALEDLDVLISDLKDESRRQKVAEAVKTFYESSRENSEREINFSRCASYGEIGKLYLNRLYRRLDNEKDETTRRSIEDKIKNLVAGKISQDEIATFKMDLFEKNLKPYQMNFKHRVQALRSRISKAAGVNRNQVDLVEKIFSLYVARRGLNPARAHDKFEKSIDEYTGLLKSGNLEEIERFGQAIDEALANKPRKRARSKNSQQERSMSR